MRKGFSFVEIALGLILLALFIIGVDSGRALFHKSHIRQMVGQLKDYESSSSLFKQKFNCLPGDCKNISDALDPRARNGNGDGKILYSETNPSEVMGVWQHLTLAKMIAGDFNGNVSNTDGTGEIDASIPRVKGYSDAGVWMVYIGRYFFNSTNTPQGMFNKPDRHAMIEGGGGDPKTRIYNGFADNDMVQEMDVKADDGRPGTGNINATRGLNDTTGCTLPEGPSAYKGGVPLSYDTPENSKANCVIFYWFDL